MVCSITPEAVFQLGIEMMGRVGKSEAKSQEDFVTQFGTSPPIVAEVARLLESNTNHYTLYPKTQLKHILWAFTRLKVYEKEATLTNIVATAYEGAPSGRTYRDWSWPLITSIATLKNEVVRTTAVIAKSLNAAPCPHAYASRCILSSLFCPKIHPNWANRRDGQGPWDKSICVDGVTVGTTESYPFHSGNYDKKRNGPGKNFELCTDMAGNIVKISGPHPAGFYPDHVIFLEETMAALDIDEKCEGDRLYRNQLPAYFPADRNDDEKEFANRRRARHETMNGRLKRFGCLDKKFTHGDIKLSDCFEAVAVITQLEIDAGKKLFDLM